MSIFIYTLFVNTDTLLRKNKIPIAEKSLNDPKTIFSLILIYYKIMTHPVK